MCSSVRGIASEAGRILLNFLFDEADVNRVEAEVIPANNLSKGVLLKNGFLKEGLIRQGALWPGKGIIDLEVYGILKDDYKNRKD